MAGARLGMGFACKELISDLNTVKYSTNPYNINRMTMAAGIGALSDDVYFRRNCAQIIQTRELTTAQLRSLGFTVIDSMANFVFAKHPAIDGEALYQSLKQRGILVRHFSSEKLKDYNRITIGSPDEMQTLYSTLTTILEGYQ